MTKHDGPHAGVPGRPRDDTTLYVRIVHRTDMAHPGTDVFMTRAVWRWLGSPARVDFDLLKGWRYFIQPGDDFAVINAASGMPRITLRSYNAQWLSLHEGRWPAKRDGGGVVFETLRNDPPT